MTSTPAMPGGKTIPVPEMRLRAGCCQCNAFLRGEHFEHSDEVRIIATCTGCFKEEARIFNGAAYRARGVDLLRESYVARSPFSRAQPVKSLANTLAEREQSKLAAPVVVDKPPDKRGSRQRLLRGWWVRVCDLKTGDIIVGPIPDLAGPQRINVNEKIVIITVTRGAYDYRVRYRRVADDSYGTFTHEGSRAAQCIGNEYLPNEAVAAGVVDRLNPGDRIAWRDEPHHKYAHGTVLWWNEKIGKYRIRLDEDNRIKSTEMELTEAQVADRNRFVRLDPGMTTIDRV